VWAKINTEANPNKEATLVAKYDIDAGTTPTYTLYTEATSIYFRIRDSDGDAANAIVARGDYLNEWHHYVGVRDGNTARLYIDGVQVDSDTNNDVGSTDNNHPITIGKLFREDYSLDGSIDEVMIFNRSLSADEIKSLYVTGSTDHKNNGVGINWTESTSGEQEFKEHPIKDNFYNATFTIQTDTNYIMPEVYYYSGDYGFYSPILMNNITFDFFSGEVEEDVTPPVISNIANESTDNESTIITFDTDESANFTIRVYNHSNRTSNFLVNTSYNLSYATSHNPYIDGLMNFTTYFVNISVWDSSGNNAEDNTFNFTTASNEVVADTTSICRKWYIGNLSSSSLLFSIDCQGEVNITNTIYVDDKQGLTANYTLLGCWQSFTYGILTDTNCTIP
jgi:hypothetical protein